ncbi:MAG: aminotransferase class I/II-fold pyridoxal phosphate-dependent enzyme [Planctomycetes bacterium]|nr:aminotransferase class I/II-fold pyridoxal phosphate-dependent enzyme [Planctomycetota bacterium]
MQLSARVQRIDASGIRRIFDLARSCRDPIDLSIGQPDFPIAEPVKAAAIAAIQGDRNGYTQTQGLAELRALCLAEERAHTGRSWKDDEILITSGVSGGLFLALLALVEDGSEALIPDPYFVSYLHLVRLFGGTPVLIDTYGSDFLPTPEAIARAITPRTRVLLLNSPANPTGRIIPEALLREIAAVCTKHGIVIVSDEIYRAFAYDGAAPSISRYHEETVVLVGHSKSQAMTGWRLGYACGPRPLIQAMTKVQQYSFVCAPSLAQYAALACPAVDRRADIAAYRARRDLMRGLLSPPLRIAPADGAFYLWIEAPAGMTGTAFAERAIAANCLIIPGSVFSARDSHVRVCYTTSTERLRAGAAILLRIAQQSVVER